MNYFLSRLCFAAALSLFTIAHANTFLNLTLNGYAHDDKHLNIPELQVNGLLNLDTTTGTFIGGSLDFITEPYVFKVDQYGATEDGVVLDYLSFSNTVDQFGYSTESGGGQFNIELGLALPISSLVGYQGGDLCSESNFAVCGQTGSIIALNGHEVLNFEDGSLAPAPEPPSLILLGTGAISVIVAARRKVIRH